jgi:C4-dicarboxylate transporter DctM subunit
MAGILPGIMLAFMFCLYSIWWVWRKDKRHPEKRAARSGHIPLTWGMLGSLLMIPLILGGIYAGWFTPTEAAGIGVIYAFVLTVFFKRTLTWQRFVDALRDSVVTSCMILMLIAGAAVFGNTLSLLRVPQDFATWLEALNLSSWQFMIAVNILYLVLGMFMDASAAILVTVPILLPGLEALHIDLIWFGVILVINMEIGAVTPPVGMNLFVVRGLRSDYTIREVLIGSLPYAALGLVGLALVVIFPQIALFLPTAGGI